MATASEFISYLLPHVNSSIYVWGAQGQALKDLSEQKIRSMETSAANAKKAIALWNRRKDIPGAKAFDCSGLGMYFLYNITRTLPGDMTADGMMRTCKKIGRNEVKRGDWVFKVYASGAAYHIGYIVDDALSVVEAQGRAYGVVKRPLSAGGWNRYGRPTCFGAETAAPVTPKPTNSTGGKCEVNVAIIRKGSKGAGVKAIQGILNGLGYSCGSVDGIAGTKTVAAIKKYQAAKGLTADSIAGAKTWDRLLNG